MSTSSLPSSPSLRGQRFFLAALLLLFTALGVRYSFKVLDNRSAFRRWQPQVLDLEKGIDINERYNYPNPPVMAVLLEPLAKLPPLAGALTWFYLKVALTLISFHWLFRIVEEPEAPFPTWAKGLTVLVGLKPVVDDLNHGNVNLFILFLVVGALYAYRRKWDVLSGGVLALAIACKVTPALFVPYLLYKRAWKALAGVALGLGLFLYPGVVPSLRLGFEENQHQLLSWYRVMVYPFLVEGKVTTEHSNQSLPGVVARLATHAPSFSTWVDNVCVPTRYDNLLDLSPEQGRWLVKGLLLCFALVVAACCRTPTQPRDNWRLAAECGLVCVGMLLFSERTWKHHAVTLLLPQAVLCYLLATRPALSWRVALGCCLAVTTGLLLATGLGPAVESHSTRLTFAKLTQVYGAYTLAFLALGACMAALLRVREAAKPQAAPAVPTPQEPLAA